MTKNKLKLVLPNKKYVASYLKMEKEFISDGTKSASGSLGQLNSVKEFSVYNKKAVEKRKGINIRKGTVPSTLYWAVVGEKVVGRLSLRHGPWKGSNPSHIGYAVKPTERKKGYGTEMLRLGLKEAKKLGIHKVVMGCMAKNIASKKIIEANGGIFLKKYIEDGVPALRFFIKN